MRPLTGYLLHHYEVFRPGKLFVHRMLNQSGLWANNLWRDSLKMVRPPRCTTLKLIPEFYSDVTFWRLLTEARCITEGVHCMSPLYSFFCNFPFKLFGPTRPATERGGIA